MEDQVNRRSWPPRSAYLHIPFCHRRCFYCDFAVVPLGDHADGANSGSIAGYLELLLGEIAAAPAGPPLATVYVGGGTPSMLTPAQVGSLLAALATHFGLAPGAEISLEMDPASFDGPRLAGYLAAGVNRVSLGGQSFDDAVLARLGRRHRSTDLLQAASWLHQARQGGDLASWSLDLIQGLPEQGLAAWRQQLAQAVALAPPHLSIYDLIIEPGTVFAWRQGRGELELPDADLGADLMKRHSAAIQKMVQDGAGQSTPVRLTQLPEAERQKWVDGLPDLAADWSKQMEGRKLPGRQVVNTWMDGLKAGGVKPARDWSKGV
jgi:oxygen-independent coproporphyrinogen-3 oxidase